jgi:hypothetical protein
MMIQLIYISTAQHGPTKVEPPAILAVSQRNNRRVGVTGMLMYDGLRFLQALEGDEAAVRETFSRIRGDTRHRGVVTLSERAIFAREFGAWDMAYEDSLTSPTARSLVEQVEALVEKVENRSTRELFRSFARIDRYVAA